MNPKNKKAIEESKNLKEYSQALQNGFNLKECKPGKFMKNTFIYALIGKLGKDFKISDETKKQALDTENMEEFMKLIESNYNTKAEFSPTVRNSLVFHTEAFQKMINLKEK